MVNVSPPEKGPRSPAGASMAAVPSLNVVPSKSIKRSNRVCSKVGSAIPSTGSGLTASDPAHGVRRKMASGGPSRGVVGGGAAAEVADGTVDSVPVGKPAVAGNRLQANRKSAPISAALPRRTLIHPPLRVESNPSPAD